MLVKKRYLTLPTPFITENGDTLKDPVVAYEEYGHLDGPVIFIAHGGLSDQHAAGKYTEKEITAGWWDGLIGPDKAFDTTRYRIISTNALGSMFGTCSALTTNPATNKPYGPDFPEITLIDMVRFQKAFLDAIGIKKIAVMAGPSMGSLQSLQMAALYPEFVGGVIAIATAGRMTPFGMAMHHFIINAAKMDPEFNDGWYEEGQPQLALNLINQVSRFFFAHPRVIEKYCWHNVPDSPDAQRKRSRNVALYLTQGMSDQIANRDLNCYITITKAINTYDLGRDAESYKAGVQRIQCPVLLMNITTDSEFPPHWAEEVANILNEKSPVQARVIKLDSDWGHLGCVKETAQMTPYIKEFLSNHSL